MLDALLWYAWIQVFALAGWLIASRWLRGLADRGYGLSKALGLLLGGFVYWISVTLGLAENNTGAVLLALAVLFVVGFVLRRLRDDGRPTTDDGSLTVVGRRSSVVSALPFSVILTTELLFAIAFAVCALYRAYNPAIVESGGEKYMESMMINAILRSSHFPPNDAWLSGLSISYYYFGYVILAMLTRISGVAPSIGFNLGGATVFALTLTGAFSIGFNLWSLKMGNGAWGVGKHEAATSPSPFPISHSPSRPILAGLLTALMLGVMGNMGGLMGVLRCGNVLPASTWQWLDIREIATQQTQCDGLRPSGYFYSWWWDWSRVVKDYGPDGNVVEIITETPAFSAILGDNHPHVLALPFVLLALGLALNALGEQTDDRRRTTDDGEPLSSVIRRPSSLFLTRLVLTAIIAGGLSFMNTWDFPVYGALIVGGSLLAAWRRRVPLWPALASGIAMLILAYVLYLPFYATFSSQARGIGINLFNATRLPQFFLMFAPFMVAFAGFLIYMLGQVRLPRHQIAVRTAGLTVGAVLLCVLVVVVFGLISPQGRAWAAELNSTGSVMGITREQVNQRLIERLTNPWTAVLLCVGIAACVVLVWAQLRSERTSFPEPFARSWDLGPAPIVVLTLFAAGAGLTLVPEFIFLQDLFGTRMNTVFKFYYQAWTLWSVAGAFALMTLITTSKVPMRILGVVGVVLVAAGLLYPVMAAMSKTDNFTAAPTLDGSFWLTQSNPDDAQTIAWLNQNVSGDPVILEQPAPGSYTYQGRIAAFTGLPTVLGWGGHENQWRGNYDEPARREPMITTLYSTTDLDEARNLLGQLNVTYVVVGSTERGTYPAEGLIKFDTLCSTAFESGSTTLYKCR